MSNPYQSGYGSGGGTPQQPGGEGLRVSPNTGKPMKKVTINGENNKSVTIDVDEQGGVFLDPKELAELAEIKDVHVLLTHTIKEAATQYQQPGGSQGYGSQGYK